MIYVGIDPGLHGAVAIVWETEFLREKAEVFDTPITKAKRGYAYLPGSMRGLLDDVEERWRLKAEGVLVLIEDVAGFPPGNSKATIAKQFRGIGLWEGIVIGLGLPYELVRAQVWKGGVGIPKGSPKGVSRAVAQRLFPEIGRGGYLDRVKDDGRGDALLIAEWGRRQDSGGGTPALIAGEGAGQGILIDDQAEGGGDAL